MDITVETLKRFGFEETLRNDERGALWLEKEINNESEYGHNWVIRYEQFENKLDAFYIEADGGRERTGEFCIKHFRTIENIENLINAMELAQ